MRRKAIGAVALVGAVTLGVVIGWQLTPVNSPQGTMAATLQQSADTELQESLQKLQEANDILTQAAQDAVDGTTEGLQGKLLEAWALVMKALPPDCDSLCMRYAEFYSYYDRASRMLFLPLDTPTYRTQLAGLVAEMKSWKDMMEESLSGPGSAIAAAPGVSEDISIPDVDVPERLHEGEGDLDCAVEALGEVNELLLDAARSFGIAGEEGVDFESLFTRCLVKAQEAKLGALSCFPDLFCTPFYDLYALARHLDDHLTAAMGLALTAQDVHDRDHLLAEILAAVEWKEDLEAALKGCQSASRNAGIQEAAEDTVEENQAPEPVPSCPRQLCLCGEGLFRSTRSRDPDGEIVSYFWSFGDGSTARGQTVRHSFEETGDYEVCLTVHDNEGAEAEECCTVKVIFCVGDGGGFQSVAEVRSRGLHLDALDGT